MDLSLNRACSTCGKLDVNMKKCSRCTLRFYCSKECQIKDWNIGHKNICKPPTTEEIILRDINKILAQPAMVTFQTMLRRAIQNNKNNEKIKYLDIVFMESEVNAIDVFTSIYFGVSHLEKKEFLKKVGKNMIDLGREADLANPETIPLINIKVIGKSNIENGYKFTHVVSGANYLWMDNETKGNLGSTALSISIYKPTNLSVSAIKSNNEEIEKITPLSLRQIFNQKMASFELAIEQFETGEIYIVSNEGKLSRLDIKDNPNLIKIKELKLKESVELKI
jgi:hypothetical protein